MSRKWNRVLAFFLAIALVITTFGSDFASAKSFAADGETVTAQEETPAAQDNAEEKSFSEIKEDIPEATEPAEETEPDVTPAETPAVAPADGANNDTPAAVEGTGDEVPTEQSEAVEDAKEDDETSEDAEEAEEETEETEEDEEEAADKEAAEEKSTEKKLIGDAVVDNIKIELFAADGVFPEDAELNVAKVEGDKEAAVVEAVEEEVKNNTDLNDNQELSVDTLAFDINVYSPSLGTNVQPADETAVNVVFSQVTQAQSKDADLSVYYVSNDLDVEKKAEVGGTATTIDFDTTHFSIYTVTITQITEHLFSEDTEENFTFNIELVDRSGKTIDNVQKAFQTYSHDKIAISGLDPFADNDDYKYIGAYYVTNDEQFKDFISDASLRIVNLPAYKYVLEVNYFQLVGAKYWNGYLYEKQQVYVYPTYLTSPIPYGNLNNGKLVFVYDKKETPKPTPVVKTSNHVDLGLTGADFQRYKELKATLSVKIGENGSFRTMSEYGYDEGVKNYEYRYLLNGNTTVTSKDKITFKVSYKKNGKTVEFTKEASEQDIIDAYDRCKTGHPTVGPSIWGFDFEYTFTEDFDIPGTVIYHSYDDKATLNDPVDDITAQYTVLSYAETKLANNETYEFKGGADTKNATTAKYEAGKKYTLEFDENDKVNLYPVWSSKLTKTDDHLDLGFTDSKEYSFYKDHATVYGKVGNSGWKEMYATDLDEDIKSYEFRLYLGNYRGSYKYSGISTAKVTDSISFKVVYKDGTEEQLFTKDCTTEENEAASNLCYDSHKHRKQAAYGFDYVFSFSEDFDLQGDVIYHAGFDVEGAGKDRWADTVKWNFSKTKEYTILGYDKTELVARDGYTFMGWTTVENGTVADPAKAVGKKITLSKGDKVDLYAVWGGVDLSKTDDHIDLGLEKEDYYMYRNGGAVVSVWVNGTHYEKVTAIGEDKEMGTYEYRLWLGNYKGSRDHWNDYSGLDTVSVNDTIIFQVDYLGQTYIYRSTTELNTKASNDCFNAHKKIQKIFGFDYKLKFTEVFKLTGDVVYHANFEVAEGQVAEIADNVNFFWWQDEKDYSVKKYTDVSVTHHYVTKKLPDNKGYEFLGWSTDPEATEAEYQPGAVIKAKRDKQIDLYAVWKLEKYAVAVYATGPVKETVVNPNFAKTLKVDYIQEDGYYPIGVIEMDSTFFKGKNYTYITSDDDWAKVQEAFAKTFKTDYNAGKNLNNTVYNNLKYVQVDYNGVENSHKTALFDWRWGDSKTIQEIDGKNYKYHLDLQFKTNDVNYIAVYPEGITDDLATSVVLTGSEVDLPDATVIDGKYDANKYQVQGYYADAACTTEFAADTYTVSDDTDIYVKLALKEKWKLIVNINVDDDGENYKTVKYDATPQEVNVDITLDVNTVQTQKRILPDTTEVTKVIENILSQFGSIFTLKVYAADVPEGWKEITATITEKINGVDHTFKVSNIYLEGGKGITVGEYPVNLHTENLVVKALDADGNPVGENLANEVFDDDSIQIITNVAPKPAVTLLAEEDGDVTAPVAEAPSGVYEVGKLTIKKREVTLTSASASKTYDGKALTATDDPVESYPEDQTFGFVDGHKVIITNTTSVVGSADKKTEVPNEFTYRFEDETLAGNYEVTPVFGTLTVNPRRSQNITPPPDQRDETPDTPAAPGAVLGAKREAAAEGAVLGARRGGTEDPTNNAARVIVIVVAAGIAISIMFFGRKKEDSEE